MIGRSWLAAAISLTALWVSSCASISVNALPQPGESYSDGYDIVIEFANVLNLPDRAKVVMDGSSVGVVAKVAVKKRDVDVTARIARGVQVSSNIHAVLQQATVLGDIYVSLERPQPDVPATSALAPGGTIPLAQTTSPHNWKTPSRILRTSCPADPFNDCRTPSSELITLRPRGIRPARSRRESPLTSRTSAMT